nr:MAG TPA: hypothetical protein [Caudoviricetes sp.]
MTCFTWASGHTTQRPRDKLVLSTGNEPRG